jgi:hypothetical protein
VLTLYMVAIPAAVILILGAIALILCDKADIPDVLRALSRFFEHPVRQRSRQGSVLDPDPDSACAAHQAPPLPTGATSMPTGGRGSATDVLFSGLVGLGVPALARSGLGSRHSDSIRGNN